MLLFRPCIDVHQGKVKQIVGSTLGRKKVKENFISKNSPLDYGKIYHSHQLKYGHIIMLTHTLTDQKAVKTIIQKHPQVYHVGGGIDVENAQNWLKWGAKRVIFSSYLFNPIETLEEKLQIIKKIGKSKVVIDLSCQQRNKKYFLATKGWKEITPFEINKRNLTFLSQYSFEFLVHSIAYEGKKKGIDISLIKKLGKESPLPCVYGGGVSSYSDIALIKKWGNRKVFFTVGSGLNLFGGNLELKKIIEKSII